MARTTMVVILAATLWPHLLYAETPAVPGPIAAAARRAAPLTSSGSGGLGSRKGALIGALVGGGAAATVTYLVAKRYGENEGGEFCGGCFAQWGAWTIPAGALVGGVIGAQVWRNTARDYTPRPRGTFITPLVGRRGGAVVISMRY